MIRKGDRVRIVLDGWRDILGKVVKVKAREEAETRLHPYLRFLVALRHPHVGNKEVTIWFCEDQLKRLETIRKGDSVRILRYWDSKCWLTGAVARVLRVRTQAEAARQFGLRYQVIVTQPDSVKGLKTWFKESEVERLEG